MASWQQVKDDFSLLDDWEDRYRYIIELGRDLPDLNEAYQTDSNKVQGCVSQVWLVVNTNSGQDTGPTLHFEGTSDAAIVQGLIAILFSLYQDKAPEEILAIDAAARLKELGLDEHLTPQRSNGLASMIARMRDDAKRHMPDTATQ